MKHAENGMMEALTYISQHAWLQTFLVIFGILAFVALMLSLFFSWGDHPKERFASELPPPGSEGFLTALARLTGAPIEPGSPIKILNNGDGFLPVFIEAISKAKKSINIMAYIWEKGEMSDMVFEVLIERARAGVQVRILLDGFGGAKAPETSIKKLCEAGGKVLSFRPARLSKALRFHRRNHRRSMVIDGLIGFTGGMAISDHWLGQPYKHDRWRDMMFEVRGRMAASLQGVFAELWAGTCGEILAGDMFYPPLSPSEGPSVFIGIPSSPAADTQPLPRFFWFSMSSARKNIYITSPYFTPDKHIRMAIMERAKAGIDVRMILPSRYTDAHPIRWATHSYYQTFLDAGVRIYEYQPARIHTKSLVVDGIWSVIGSANMDVRSKELNEENILGIADERFAKEMEETFFADLEGSKEITPEAWRRRNKILLGFEYLFRSFTKQY